MDNALLIPALVGKWRFPAVVGDLTLEQLFDLPLTSARGPSLDGTARALARGLRDQGEESFVDAAAADPTHLRARLEIVKAVIEWVKGANAARIEAAGKSATKQKLLAALASKEDQKLGDMSEDDIRKAIAEL